MYLGALEEFGDTCCWSFRCNVGVPIGSREPEPLAPGRTLSTAQQCGSQLGNSGFGRIGRQLGQGGVEAGPPGEHSVASLLGSQQPARCNLLCDLLWRQIVVLYR